MHTRDNDWLKQAGISAVCPYFFLTLTKLVISNQGFRSGVKLGFSGRPNPVREKWHSKSRGKNLVITVLVPNLRSRVDAVS